MKLELIGEPPGNVCAVCGKVSFETRGAASKQARRQTRQTGSPMRPYFSDECGVWHLTKIER